MLKELTQAFGVCGYENEVREIIKKAVEGLADEIMSDALGNLIVHKKGSDPEKKKIMMSAHTDEIGLQVIKIEDNGNIRVKPLGHHWVPTTYMSRVRFRNGVVGTVSSIIPVEQVKENDSTKLYIDIGTFTKESALRQVKVGDVACFEGSFEELKDGNVMAKALDDRVGCHILIEVLKKVEKPINDLYFVFAVQEELGLRGSRTAAARIMPDIGIAVDVTPAHDHQNGMEGSNALGQGAAIKVSDTSVICDEYLISEMVDCCEVNNIKYQRDVTYVGGCDSAAINQSGEGVRVAAISVPSRFAHSPNAIVNMKDVEASIELLQKYINRRFAF